MIPYKEYAACKAAERKALTATKSTSEIEEEENWDDKPQCPPRSTPPSARVAPSSQEDGWRLMVTQDPCPDSVAGDSGHGTMAMTSETEPVTSNEELIGAMGGTDENVSTGYCADVEWKEEDILIEINDENVTIPQMPAAASTPVQALTESEMLSPTESLEGKKLFQGINCCLTLKISPSMSETGLQ